MHKSLNSFFAFLHCRMGFMRVMPPKAKNELAGASMYLRKARNLKDVFSSV